MMEHSRGFKSQKVGRKPKLNIPYPNYSYVTEWFGYRVKNNLKLNLPLKFEISRTFKNSTKDT